MVEDVKEFRTELDPAAFAQESSAKVLNERHVEISNARAFDRVSTSVAECVERWKHKGIRVKPLFRISVAPGPVRIADRVRALPRSAHIRLVIGNEGRDGLTRLKRHDARKLPTTSKRVSNAFEGESPIFADRQIPRIAVGQAMTYIKVRVSALATQVVR